MHEPKKDESIKTGLQGESNKDREKDPDELVHELPVEVPEAPREKDMDELVHELPSTPPEDTLQERDPDDLVHDPGIIPDEE